MSYNFQQPFMTLGNGLNTLQGGGGVGGWKELGRTTLGSTADSIDVSSLADKRYLMFLNDFKPSGATTNFQRFNNDSGSNYAYRLSDNGGADATGVSQANNYWYGYGTTGIPEFTVAYQANLSSKEKLQLQFTTQQNTAGAGTAPNRRNGVNKWVNTSSPIDQITMVNTGVGDFNTGSELVVLGWDAADTHTTNFWEELASVDLSGGAAAEISSGTITAKKYLWVQVYVQGQTGTSTNHFLNFNSDTASNYSNRESHNGAADGTRVSQTKAYTYVGFDDTVDSLMNAFIINNSAEEKLGTTHTVNNILDGAATAPSRFESNIKWANTSSQITEIDYGTDSGNMGTGTLMKVWGSD